MVGFHGGLQNAVINRMILDFISDYTYLKKREKIAAVFGHEFNVAVIGIAFLFRNYLKSNAMKF